MLAAFPKQWRMMKYVKAQCCSFANCQLECYPAGTHQKMESASACTNDRGMPILPFRLWEPENTIQGESTRNKTPILGKFRRKKFSSKCMECTTIQANHSENQMPHSFLLVREN